jgi:hypothetical protein
MWMFSGIARVGDALAAEADLMCTIRAIDEAKSGE